MRKLFTMLTLLVIAATALRTTASPALGQSDAPPPKVAQTSPASHEEIAPDTAVKITFDQPMDKASVEASLSIEPAIKPAASWLDERTLSIVPLGAARGGQYTLKINSGAKAANGAALAETYRLAIDIAGALKVVQVIPAPGSREVQAGSSITVVFNRPVVPLVDTSAQDKLPQPLSLSPGVKGRGEWVNSSIYVFKPETALPGGASFTASIDGMLRDTTGGPLDAPYTWKFTTIAPQILSADPQNQTNQIPLESPIRVTFNQPMDRTTTQDAFALLGRSGAKISGTFVWSENDTVLGFKPDAKLDLGVTYRIVVTASARSAAGSATLANPISYTFQTVPYPALIDSQPKNGQQDAQPGGGVNLIFSAPMDQKSFAEKVTVEPKPAELAVSGYGQNVYISFASKPRTDYTVTVAAGVADMYGNTIKEPITIRFRTTDFEPALYVPQFGFVNVTNAYLPQTSLLAQTTNLTTLDVAVSAITHPQLNVIRGNADAFGQIGTLRRFSVKSNGDANAQNLTRLLLGPDQAGVLAPGLYYIRVEAPELRGTSDFQYRGRQNIVLAVSTASLTVKQTANSILVWATDLKTGQPIANARIDLWENYILPLGAGKTDASGLLTLPVAGANQRGNVSAVLNSDGQFAVSGGASYINAYDFGVVNSAGRARQLVSYIYTDQPIYRPDRPVYFKGALRDLNDVTYAIPKFKTALVRVVDTQGKTVSEQPITLTEFGTFNGQYALAKDAPLGYYAFNLIVDGISYSAGGFQVAEYRVPEFQVSATATEPQVVKSATVKVTVDSKFFFGGPVSNAAVQWNALASPGYFNYTGDGEWQFGAGSPYWWFSEGFYGGRGYYGGRSVGSGTGRTDKDGKFTIELPASLAANTQETFTIEATVTDISNQAISGRTSVTVHPADLYIGLHNETTIARTDEPAKVALIAVDWASKPIANQKVKVAALLQKWEQDPKTLEWKQADKEIAASDVLTDASGRAAFSFTPKEAGLYRIVATSLDKAERTAESNTYVWVTGPQPFRIGDRYDKALRMTSDKRAYKPGETAQILIPSPFNGSVKALVTVERAGIIKQEIITVQGGALYSLPITDQFAPDVYVAVTLIKGMESASDDPDYRSGVLKLNVEVKQQLTVTLKPSVTRAQPGQTVKFDVLTTDRDGKPVSASVGVKLTDLANLSVAGSSDAGIFEAFWSDRGLSVLTQVSLASLIDIIKPDAERRDKEAGFASNEAQPSLQSAAADGAVGAPPPSARNAAPAPGVAQEPAVTPRTNFVDTPLWSPEVVTDANGRGSVEVKLPDNLTTWRLDGRGISKDTYVGQGETDLISTKPLLVRPATPRFFIVGDEAELATVVNNNSGADLSVQVRLDLKGAQLVGDAVQTVNIPKDGRVRVVWRVTVPDVPAVDAAFIATSGEYSDGAKPDVGQGPDKLLPVYRYEAPDYVSTAGALTAASTRTELIQLPTGATAARAGDLTINLNTSLAAVTLDGLTYLKNFPYQCTEQTISKFLPNVITFRALQKLGQSSPELQANLQTAIAEALARLKNGQHEDGGWGWYRADESSPLVTAYAMLGLLEAKASDVAIDATMYQRGLAFLLGKQERATLQTPVYMMNMQAFVAYVLARLGQPPQMLESLYSQRERISYFARAFLAQAYSLVPSADRGRVDTLLSDLANAAVVSASGIHFEEKARDWWNWDSNTRTTAIILETLVKLQPKSELIPNIVRWLIVARRGDAWETTQETAWSVMSLTNYMAVSGELKANYPYTVLLNGKELTAGTAGPQTLKVTQTLTQQIATMLTDQANRLNVNRGAGEGAFYYTATLRLMQPVEAIKPAARGLSFTRQYFIGDKVVTTAKIGDVITVALDITVPHDLYYAVINDPIPAGTEMVDTSLTTTSQIGQAPALDRVDAKYGWGWWWFSETQLRTEKAVLTARYLPAGTYRYTYQIRASQVGTYRVIPPNGNEFYFPEVFGRGSGSLFTVTP